MDVPSSSDKVSVVELSFATIDASPVVPPCASFTIFSESCNLGIDLSGVASTCSLLSAFVSKSSINVSNVSVILLYRPPTP